MVLGHSISLSCDLRRKCKFRFVVVWLTVLWVVGVPSNGVLFSRKEFVDVLLSLSCHFADSSKRNSAFSRNRRLEPNLDLRRSSSGWWTNRGCFFYIYLLSFLFCPPLLQRVEESEMVGACHHSLLCVSLMEKPLMSLVATETWVSASSWCLPTSLGKSTLFLILAGRYRSWCCLIDDGVMIYHLMLHQSPLDLPMMTFLSERFCALVSGPFENRRKSWILNDGRWKHFLFIKFVRLFPSFGKHDSKDLWSIHHRRLHIIAIIVCSCDCLYFPHLPVRTSVPFIALVALRRDSDAVIDVLESLRIDRSKQKAVPMNARRIYSVHE